MRKISIIIVNWNGRKFLDKCITSLINQSYKNKEIVMVDNNSEDDSIKFVEKTFKDKVRIVENVNNGYAGGANRGIRETTGDFVAIVNPDVVFESDYLSNCINYFDKNEKVGAISGKLLKYDFDTNEKKNIIDSVGISIKKNRSAYDIGQNTIDSGQYEIAKRVFAVCGAASIYRRKFIEKIKFEDEYFDEDFFAYKEDIDLCWRLNWIGIESHYIPNAVAYHGRGMNSAKGLIEFLINRKKQSSYLQGISFRNQYLMIYKNEKFNNMQKDMFKIILRFFQYIIYFFIFNPSNLKNVKNIWVIIKKKISRKKQHLLSIKTEDERTIYALFD
ncbi:glycosyltransferase family 2 protein [Clostridium intestinale]|uniref:Glycosyltransferase family 2 protein n=1 Tax=Clostridium intestinale TaxID=36845 RepID=A0A7D6ZGJ8_9CLOT|nr:glycosyltransferase family 2 protein [Clostridium intestinale]QLY79139.1 glycosyltransferase family 2 protein [Clostridium intestinale]